MNIVIESADVAGLKLAGHDISGDGLMKNRPFFSLVLIRWTRRSGAGGGASPHHLVVAMDGGCPSQRERRK